MVDLKFAGMTGGWQHFTLPIERLSPEAMASGVDAGRIRTPFGNEMDAVLLPDSDSAFMDPFCGVPTLSLLGSVASSEATGLVDWDPRGIAGRAMKLLAHEAVIGDARFGLRTGFFVFDDVRYEARRNGCACWVDSVEAEWNSGREEAPNLGFKIGTETAGAPVPPADSLQDLRTEMVLTMEQLGLGVVDHRHGQGSPGRCEIGFQERNLVRAADLLLLGKHVVKNVARRHGKTASFMPKPLSGEPRLELKVVVSLLRRDRSSASGEGTRAPAEVVGHFAAGIVDHAESLAAFCNPIVNSYRGTMGAGVASGSGAASFGELGSLLRLLPARWPDTGLHLEIGFPDPSANPYLCLPALVLAGLDGVRRGLNPEDVVASRRNKGGGRFELLPGCLEAALSALETDHDYLVRDGAFSDGFLAELVRGRRRECRSVAEQPHPREFSLYFDC